MELYSCFEKGRFVSNMVYLRGICGHVSEWNSARVLIPFHVKEVDRNKTATFS